MALYPKTGQIISTDGISTGNTAVEAPTGFWRLGGRERRRDPFAGRGRRVRHVGTYAAGILRGRHAERGEAGGGPEQSAVGARHRVLSPRRPGEKLRRARLRLALRLYGAAPEKPAPRERAAVT